LATFLSLLALVIALVAFRRTDGSEAASKLGERLLALEGRVEQLRLALRDLQRGAPASAEPAEASTAAPPSPPPPTQPEQRQIPAQPSQPVVARPAPPPAPPRAPSSAPRPPTPPRKPPPIDVEQLLGVRGAAIAGGVVLALAAIYFLKYSIDNGLLPPAVRVALGGITGIACLLVSEPQLVRARYGRTSEALAGAGIVILYAAFWAARVLYRLIGPEFAFVGMIAVTVACAVLSLRRDALVIAVLGLTGGFLTPLLLSSGRDQPIGLFGYLLLLDIALLALARRRKWPGLALASLVATALYEVVWLTTRLTPGRLALGLAILGVFAALFAFSTVRRDGAEAPPELRTAQAAGVLFPFSMALYLAAHARLTPQLWPLALLLLPLVGAAAWLARARREPWIGTAAAAAAVAVLLMWSATQTLDTSRAWQLAVVAVALAGLLHAFVERERGAPLLAGPGLAAAVASFGLLLILLAVSFSAPHVAFVASGCGSVALAAIALRQGAFVGRGAMQVAAAALVGLALSAHVASRAAELPLSLELLLALMLGLALALQAFATLRRGRAEHAWSEHAAAVFALCGLLGLASLDMTALSSALTLGASLAFGVLPLLSATRLASGAWLLPALAATALVQLRWSLDLAAPAMSARFYGAGLAVQIVSAALFALWPFAAGERLLRDRYAAWASALAPLLWFPSVLTLFRGAAGDGADGLPAIALAGFGLAGARSAQRLLPADDAARRRQLVWQLAVALAFGAIAVPLQLSQEWITIAWALEALALVWLWRRFDHPGLKWIAFALLAAVTTRLVLNPSLLDYHDASRLPFLNWLLYTYLVPAACSVGAARWLAPLEVPRLRAFERSFSAQRAWMAAAFGIAALVLVFVWLNLAIVDAFAEGGPLTLDLARKPARDLSISLAWGSYALALLALGVRRASRGLRWASLVLIMITIGKVFLYDVGELEDLYRVASLLGLALSLISVSLAYQRFVFRDEARRTE